MLCQVKQLQGCKKYQFLHFKHHFQQTYVGYCVLPESAQKGGWTLLQIKASCIQFRLVCFYLPLWHQNIQQQTTRSDPCHLFIIIYSNFWQTQHMYHSLAIADFESVQWGNSLPQCFQNNLNNRPKSLWWLHWNPHSSADTSKGYRSDWHWCLRSTMTWLI